MLVDDLFRANLGGFSEDLNRMLNEDGALDTFTKETIQSRKETAQQLQQNAEETARISRERGLNGLASQMELAAQGFGNIAQRMENMQQEDPANPDSWTARREELQAVLTDVGGVKSALSGAAAEVVEALGMDLEEVLNQASLSAGNLADVLATVQGVTARLANELYSLGGTMGSLESHAYQAKISIQNALRAILPDDNIDLGLPEDSVPEGPEEIDIDVQPGDPKAAADASPSSEDREAKEAAVLKLIKELDTDGKGAARDELERRAEQEGISSMELEEITDGLLNKGLAYEPNLRYVKVI